jgi:hypothetical protein
LNTRHSLAIQSAEHKNPPAKGLVITIMGYRQKISARALRRLAEKHERRMAGKGCK